jgi:hypothetical protein
MKNTNHPHKRPSTKKTMLAELADPIALDLAATEIEENKYSLKDGIKAFYTALKR